MELKRHEEKKMGMKEGRTLLKMIYDGGKSISSSTIIFSYLNGLENAAFTNYISFPLSSLKSRSFNLNLFCEIRIE